MVVDAIPADSNEPLRHNMEAKPPEELYPFHGYQFMPRPNPVVLGPEGNMGVSNVNDAMVAYSNPMRVLAQVAHHMLSLGHRSLTVDHPAGIFSTLQLLVKTTQLVYFLKLPPDAVKELPFECTAELMYWVQEVIVLADVLPLAINSISGSRNYARSGTEWM